MEKGRSLRLKRKTNPAATSTHNAKRFKTNQIEKSDQAIVKVQPIVLSSDSDEDCQLLKIPHKQRNGDLNGDLSTVKHSDSSRPEDSSLHKLKQLMYKLTSRESVDPASLPPFPPHPQESENTGALNSEAKTDLNWRLQAKLESLIPSELPPFPKPCEKCRKICKGLKSICDNTTPGSIEERNDVKTSICQKLERNDVKSTNRQKGFQSNCLNHSGSSNLNENLTDRKSSNVTSGAKNLTGAHNDMAVSSSSSSNGVASNEHVSRVLHSVASAKASEPSIIRPEVRQPANFDDNSHLMRDRNSNYYSLQSRNSQIFAQPEPCSNSEKHNSDSGEHNSDSGNRNSRSGNPDSQSAHTSPDSGKHKSNVAKLNSGLVKQSSVLDKQRSNPRTSDNGASNLDSDFVVKPSFSEASERQTAPSATHVNRSKSPVSSSERTSVLNQHGPTYDAQRTTASGSKAQISNETGGQASGNQVKKTASGNQMQKVGAGKQRQEGGAGKQRQEGGAGKHATVKPDPVLQSCPMCQMEFAEGTTQLDIDSHLATCLSSADDDFVW